MVGSLIDRSCIAACMRLGPLSSLLLFLFSGNFCIVSCVWEHKCFAINLINNAHQERMGSPHTMSPRDLLNFNVKP